MPLFDAFDEEFTLENGTLYALLKVAGDGLLFNYDNVQLQVSDLDKCGYQKGYLYLNGRVFYTSRIIKPTADIRAKGIYTYRTTPVDHPEGITHGYYLASLKKVAAQDVTGVHLVRY